MKWSERENDVSEQKRTKVTGVEGGALCALFFKKARGERKE